MRWIMQDIKDHFKQKEHWPLAIDYYVDCLLEKVRTEVRAKFIKKLSRNGFETVTDLDGHLVIQPKNKRKKTCLNTKKKKKNLRSKK